MRLSGGPAAGARRRMWVLQLWETFLMQMDDFDRLLEFQLRRKLDAVVAARVPIRRGRAVSGLGHPNKGRRGETSAKTKAMGAIPIQLHAETLVLVEYP